MLLKGEGDSADEGGSLKDEVARSELQNDEWADGVQDEVEIEDNENLLLDDEESARAECQIGTSLVTQWDTHARNDSGTPAQEGGEKFR